MKSYIFIPYLILHQKYHPSRYVKATKEIYRDRETENRLSKLAEKSLFSSPFIELHTPTAEYSKIMHYPTVQLKKKI